MEGCGGGSVPVCAGRGQGDVDDEFEVYGGVRCGYVIPAASYLPMSEDRKNVRGRV